MPTRAHKFNLYDDQVKDLKALARKRNVTYSTVLRQALDEFLVRQRCGRRPARPIIRR